MGQVQQHRVLMGYFFDHGFDYQKPQNARRYRRT